MRYVWLDIWSFVSIFLMLERFFGFILSYYMFIEGTAYGFLVFYRRNAASGGLSAFCLHERGL